MLFRGGGIGHTWKHNASKANAVPEDLYGQLGVTGFETGEEQGAGEEEDDVDVDVMADLGHETAIVDEDTVDAAEYVDSDWEDEDMNMETD